MNHSNGAPANVTSTGPGFGLRSIVLLLEAIERHTGHADVLREEIDGATDE